MECYNCSGIYNDYLGYCPYCGIKRAEFNVCGNCEEKLTKDKLVCPKCGSRPIEETKEMKSDRLNREGLMSHMTSRPSDYFNEAIRFNKYNVDAWVNKSEYLNQQTKYEAKKCCDAGLKINKDNIKLLLSKSRAIKKDDWKREGNDSEIILYDILKRCCQQLQENEFNEEMLILKGEILYELGDKEGSIECYSKSLEINPENEKSWVRKAELCHFNEDYQCEIESYKKAIELNPTNDEYYEKVGKSYEGYVKDNEKTIKYYNKALELNPYINHGFLWNTKGCLEEEMGKYDEALKSFAVLSELHHDYDMAFLSKAEIFCELNRLEDAIECYNDTLKISPNGYVRNLKANALIQLEKYEDDLEVYDEAINNNPDYKETYLNKARLLHKLGLFEEEVDCYDLLDIDNLSFQLYNRTQLDKAIALSEIDKEKSKKYFNELLQQCNHALENFPDNSDYFEIKADILYYLGDLKEAFEWYDKTLECENVTNKENIISSKGKILYELKDYEKAIECFDEALEIFDYYYALQYKGYCLEELNKYDEAMECYDKCLEIDSRDKEVLVKKSELTVKMK